MKLHPLSIPYRAVANSLNLGTVVFFVTVVGSGIDVRSLGFLASLLGYLALVGLYQLAYYQRFEYVLSEGSLDITSGVLSRRKREIPLGRIQNVDVAQNPVQRALGIAGVSIETAGGGDTEATLRYVAVDEAQRLRRELRRGAREPTGEDADVGAEAEPAAAERGDLVFALPNRNLALLSLFTIDPGVGVLASLFGAAVSGGDPENIAGIGRVLQSVPLGRTEAILLGIAVVGLLAWLLSVALTFARYYGFELRRTEDGLEYERGLLQRYSGTIPVEKIQTVSLHENVFKRRFGYATLAVETAGYSPGQSGNRQLAVPLARRPRTVDIAQSLEPFAAPELTSLPKRARTRYFFRYVLAVSAVAAAVYGVAWYLEATADVPSTYWLVLLAPLLLAPVVAHYTWIHRGYGTQDGHFLARKGFWNRVTRVVPYYRIQTVVDSRSVFQRRRRLASVTADTASTASIVGGTATAVDVDDGDAEALRELLHDRLQEQLRGERARRAERRRVSRLAEGESEPS